MKPKHEKHLTPKEVGLILDAAERDLRELCGDTTLALRTASRPYPKTPERKWRLLCSIMVANKRKDFDSHEFPTLYKCLKAAVG